MKILSKDNLVSAFSFVLRKVEGLADDIYAELNKTKKAIVSEEKYYTIGPSPYEPPNEPSVDEVDKSTVEYAVVDSAAVDIIGWGTEQLIPEEGEYLWCAVLETYVDGSQGWQEPICLTDDYVRETLKDTYTKAEVDSSISKLGTQISSDILSVETAVIKAQSTANEAIDGIFDLKSIIEDVKLSAENAQESANIAQTTANNSLSIAESATDMAGTAQTTANNALSVAESATDTAGAAQSSAENAQSVAESAVVAANTSQASAEAAQNMAQAAQTTADNAKSIADNAQTAADKAQADIDDLKSNLGTLIQAYLDDNPYYAIVG